MATTRPFAFNTGSTISGTEQIGNLAIGENNRDYSGDYGGVRWWMGPDEDLGYVIAQPRSSNDQPTQPGIVPPFGSVGFWRAVGFLDSSFIQLSEYVSDKSGFPQTFNSGTEAKTWLNDNGYWTSYISIPISPTPTPTNTPTQTQTNTPTNTPTQTETPTNTPTPSTTPIPVTGYGYNLVAIPYNFPESGNSIMNNPGDNTSGSTEINLLSTNGRGFYFNSIDSSSVDRTNYYSGFTGQSITITFSQTGNTAIYSGDTDSFKYWDTPLGTGFVFGTGIGVPPNNIPSGTAVLIQSATTQFTIGLPVYISIEING